MNHSRLRVITFSLLSLAATAVYAVDQLPEKEEDIPVEFIPQLNNTVSIGMRRLTSGPKVTFGNLGAVPPKYGSDALGSRIYSNGQVHPDGPTAGEIDANGNLITSNDYTKSRSGDYAKLEGGLIKLYGRVIAYTTTVTTDVDGKPVASYAPNTELDANGTRVYSYQKDTVGDGIYGDGFVWANYGSFVPYNSGQMRRWNVDDSSQFDFNKHTVSMSDYSVVSDGASSVVNSSGSSGFELNFERKLGQRGRWEWGFSGGLSVVSIKAQDARIVQSTLVKEIDVYNMVSTGPGLNASLINGGLDPRGASLGLFQPGNAQDQKLLDQKSGDPISAFSPDEFGGGTVVASVVGSDKSLSTPLDLTSVQQAATQYSKVDVNGIWKIKGAYYDIRFGPTLRYRINDRWAVSAGTGFSMAYIGTIFSVDEFVAGFSTPSVPLFSEIEQNNTHKFVPGYYANMNVEYWVTETTGFYFGMNRQKSGKYNQNPLSGRTVKVDLGSSSGWQLGIMTRF